MYVVQSTDGGQVTDEKGEPCDTRLVLPVAAASSVLAQVFAGGPSPEMTDGATYLESFCSPSRR